MSKDIAFSAKSLSPSDYQNRFSKHMDFEHIFFKYHFFILGLHSENGEVPEWPKGTVC